jgi:predicted CXXCH cytochrome family protein
MLAAAVFLGGDARRCGPSATEVVEAAPPPLVVDKKAPLLLDEPKKPAQDPWDAPTGPVANNQACFVCHGNYQTESMAGVHAKANVGCVKCHGESFAHRDDEDNVTPPDVMFWPEKIEPGCKECHDEHDAPAVKVIARWQECCPAKTDPKSVLCTDCHGKEHRLKVRTVRWDKQTRKLLVRKPAEPKPPADAPKEPEKKPAAAPASQAAAQK